MYATKSDMQERYTEENLVEITDRVEPYTGAIVDNVINQGLDDASAIIDSYIARRYDLPLASIPKVLTVHACIIAFYTLHQGRYTDETRQSYKDSTDFLEKIAKGIVVLDVAGTEPTSSPADARVESPEQIFNRDSLKGF